MKLSVKMAKAFCLLPNKIEAFQKALKEKKINISDLLKMSTEDRIKLLEEYAGKNAADVNYLFEQKLVLKNKLQGIKNWASKIGEIGRYSPEKQKQINEILEQYKKAQEERILNPKEEEAFLNSLADAKIGTHVTLEETQTVFELTSKSEVLKEKFDSEKNEWATEKDRLDYGAAKVLLEEYVENLKNEKLSFKDLIKQRILKTKEDYKENKAKAVTELIKDTVSTLSDASVSFVASVDNSFMGRQGITTLQTHPTIWYDMAKKSFTDFYNSVKSKQGGKEVKRLVLADAYSRPNFINGSYDIAKLLPKAEEQFPTSIPERIPYIGRVFKASENAFSNSAIRARINTFDLLEQIAKDNKVDTADKIWIKDTGRLVNSATARGDLGKLGEGGAIKLVLWAPKMLKANWDVLTAHTAGAGLETPFARRQARINLLKITIETATVAAILNAITPNSVEEDPTSSDFLRYKVGNTRFDLTSGRGSIITLIARGLTLHSKSTATGIKTALNSGDFGSKTYFDVGIDFLTNKVTPFTRAIINVSKGQDFSGKKPTLASTAIQLGTPISIQNFTKNFLGDDPSALTDNNINNTAAVLGSILDLVGISGNTYSNNEDWQTKDTKEILQFKNEVSDEEFKQANSEYNKRIKQEITTLTKTEDYRKLSEDDKVKKITKLKKDIKEAIFKEFNP